MAIWMISNGGGQARLGLVATAAVAVSLLACASSGSETLRGTAVSTASSGRTTRGGSLDQGEGSGKVSRELLDLARKFEASRDEGSTGDFEWAGPMFDLRADKVAVECSTAGDPETLAASLEALGMTGIAMFGDLVDGWLPIAAIVELPSLESLRFARAAMSTTNR